MNQELPPLTSYSEELRQNAMDKYQVIAPYLKHEESLSNIAEESGVPKRTLYHWVNQYQQSGLKGLIRRKRSDSGSFKVEENVQEEIKKLIFENKKNTLTSIHRKVCKICKKKNWAPPSYNQVYAIAKNLSPQLKELAHKGKKEYLNCQIKLDRSSILT